MTFKLPDLPYAMDALAPAMSAETLQYHYGKHHQKYVDTLNKLVQGTPHAEKSLEAIMCETKTGPVFNNAAQTWNHTFFWNGMTPHGGGRPKGKVAEMIDKQWGSFDKFKTEYSDAAIGLFGSGWLWLTRRGGGLAIEKTSNAENPLVHGNKPLLTLDVWEHAYYIDYRNDRARFVNAWWDLVNWDFVEHQL